MSEHRFFLEVDLLQENDYSEHSYKDNLLVKERDDFVIEVKDKIRELDKKIKEYRDCELKKIIQKFEIFLRPTIPGPENNNNNRENMELHRRLSNFKDFQVLQDKHGYLPGINTYGSWDNIVHFYRVAGALCTVECHKGIVIGNIPCSVGDWERIKKGEMPRKFLEKDEEGEITTQIEDPILVKARELYEQFHIQNLEEFDLWMKQERSVKEGSPREGYVEFYKNYDPHARKVLGYYLGTLTPREEVPTKTPEQIASETVELLLSGDFDSLTFSKEEGELTISGPKEMLVVAYNSLWEKYKNVALHVKKE